MEGTLHEYKEQAGSCVECGNSPVNHTLTHAAHSFAVWSSPRRAARGFVRRWFESQVTRVLPYVDLAVYRLFARLPITRFSRAIEKASTYRSQVIWEEAERRGIEMEHMTLLGRATEVYRAKPKGEWVYFQSLPVPPHLEVVDSGWIDDKFLLKAALAEAGIAVPRAVSVTNLAEARRVFRSFESSVVVKPRAGSRGRHTTVNIATLADLERAFRTAQQLCHYVVIEEYLSGSVCRGTVVGGTLQGLLQAFPPTVVGDGSATIRELVQRVNAARPDRVQAINLSHEHERFLARSGLSLEHVPERGERIALTHRTGRLFGGRTHELLSSVHPKLRAQLERAAAVLGTPLVGFDFVIADPTADPEEQRWGIIEANTLPYIDLHYLPLEGTPSPVARAVWDLWE